ncbi:hypothetical protein CRE_02562 [Caenorhabditis remanei]|uniref:Uncharacterized protein n=1 Tax=Caenorhabditis remanei TaxID=31234 RepID=E3N4U0_CAERE|nr:hypothetical protein CRE_02562 [Caenorhabditis remanei]
MNMACTSTNGRPNGRHGNGYRDESMTALTRKVAHKRTRKLFLSTVKLIMVQQELLHHHGFKTNRLGPRNFSHPYTIGGSLIDSVDSVRDLGLLIEPNLKFTRHINRAVALALLRSKQLLKSFKSNSPQFYIFLFKTYVLPLVEYCSVVYSPPPSSKLAHKLETPLRFFSRKILQRCNTPYCSYSDRLSQLDLFSMRHRRLKAQLLLLFNLIIGASYFPSLETHVRLSSSSRRPMSLICINPNCSNFFLNCNTYLECLNY